MARRDEHRVQDTPDSGYEDLLVRQAQENPHAFAELYHLYFARLYGYAAYRTETPHDAEDLVAETFLKAVEGLGRFRYRGPGSFSAWLFQIAHNLLIDAGRRKQRRGNPLPFYALVAVADTQPLPEAAASRSEEIAHVRRLVVTLSPRKQEIFTLKFFGGLRNREIAEVLGLDERSVASHLCRAVEELHRKYLDVVGLTRKGREM